MKESNFYSESQADDHIQEEQANNHNPLQTDVLEGDTEPHVEDCDQNQPISLQANQESQINRTLEGKKNLLIVPIKLYLFFN